MEGARLKAMLKLFESLKENDIKAINEYSLDSQVLMEVAAKGVATKIIEIAYSSEPFYLDLLNGFLFSIPTKKTVQVVCGASDNGGDGLALSRILQDYFDVVTVLPKPAKSKMCILQKKRLEALGISIKDEIESECDILVDALFGTGFAGEARKDDVVILQKMNNINALKIALDVPSGLDIFGVPCNECFLANFTVCIGALRSQLYSSLAKDYAGSISLVRLPLPSAKYEDETNTFLLQKCDARLPFRKKQNVNKSSFGHLAVMQGEMKGASQLVAGAALNFGVGLVSIVGSDIPLTQPDFMQNEHIPEKATCIAMGSGLGRSSKNVFSAFISYIMQHKEVKTVLDADAFYYDEIKVVLENVAHLVLTPHPKEFCSLLKITCGLDFSIEEMRKRKLDLTRFFCNKYPKVVLLLKDCNTCIAKGNQVYINALGSSALAKAGTGDVLAGMTASLMAQGYDSLDASITSSIVHAIASQNVQNNYALTASKLIKEIGKI